MVYPLIIRKYWLISQTLAVLLAVRVGASLVVLPRLLRWLHAEPAPNQWDFDRLRDLAYYVDRWLGIFPANPKGNCFPRSLALFWFARRCGFPARFICGVRRGSDGLDGHAWVMCEGRALLEPTSQWKTHTITYSYPDPDRESAAPEDSLQASHKTTSCF